MTDREHSARNEAAILDVFDNQFPTLTSQLIDNLQRLSMVGEKWPTTLLIILGAFLLFAALAIKLMLIVYYPGDEKTLRLSAMEFTTLILAASGLMVIGALFSLYQARSWRKIVMAQQLVGTELLNKQIDIAKGMVVRQQQGHQGGEMILLPAKIRRRHRR
jgi:uncharacterized membrane protein YqjE